MEAIERDAVVYPDSDGEPMADNTLQYKWIVVLVENLDAALEDHFVAGDLLWYPVRGNNRLRRAPDVLVALGRPKGHRGSFKQWVEGGPPDVVMEVLSPRNTAAHMVQKLDFYRTYGAREFYVVDPDAETLEVWQEGDPGLRSVPRGEAFESPLLGIRFEVGEHLVVFQANGTPFKTFPQILAERDEAVAERDEAVAERDEAVAALDEARSELAALKARLRRLEAGPQTSDGD